jgi:HSP20 family protein
MIVAFIQSAVVAKQSKSQRKIMILTTWQRFNRGAVSPLHRTLRDELDGLFQQALGQSATENFVPALDLAEDKEAVFARLEVPGVKKEDISISLDDGVLTITGERKEEPAREGGAVYRRERVYGKFERVISLPSRVDAAKIKATYTDGVLNVTLPKAEEAKPKQIPVELQ